MRFGIFNNFGALNSAPVFDSFIKGLNELGLEWESHDESADVAVIWSLVWAGRMKNNQEIYNRFRSSGRHVIVLEVGMIFRGQTWKIGLNGTGYGAYWGRGFSVNRATLMGLQLKPWRSSGKDIIIALQRVDSEQWRGMPPMEQWLNTTVAQLRLYTDRKIRIRCHPRQTVAVPPGCVKDVPIAIPGTYDDFDFKQSMQDAWAVINWNSSPGCHAIMHGIPAFVGPSSLAAPVGNLDFSQIENPIMPDRSRWLLEIVHTEWTCDEIASGRPVARLMDQLSQSRPNQ